MPITEKIEIQLWCVPTKVSGASAAVPFFIVFVVVAVVALENLCANKWVSWQPFFCCCCCCTGLFISQEGAEVSILTLSVVWCIDLDSCDCVSFFFVGCRNSIRQRSNQQKWIWSRTDVKMHSNKVGKCEWFCNSEVCLAVPFTANGIGCYRLQCRGGNNVFFSICFFLQLSWVTFLSVYLRIH